MYVKALHNRLWNVSRATGMILPLEKNWKLRYKQSGKISRIWPWTKLISIFTCDPGGLFSLIVPSHVLEFTLGWFAFICIAMEKRIGNYVTNLGFRTKSSLLLYCWFAFALRYKTCFESILKRGQHCEQSQMSLRSFLNRQKSQTTSKTISFTTSPFNFRNQQY